MINSELNENNKKNIKWALNFLKKSFKKPNIIQTNDYLKLSIATAKLSEAIDRGDITAKQIKDKIKSGK